MLYPILVLLMSFLSPKPNAELARAASVVIEEQRPLFQGDDSRIKTSALVVAVMFRESGFDNAARSKTNDHCAMQINGRRDLASDPVECVRVGMHKLRESIAMCPAYPVAFYAEGPKGCESARGQRISDDRVNLAKWLAKKVGDPS